MRRRPMPWTVFACALLKPMVLLTSVILTRLPSSVFFSRLAIGHRRLFLFLFLPAQAADEGRILQLAERLEGRAHHVVRVRRADRLGQDVRNAARLDHG